MLRWLAPYSVRSSVVTCLRMTSDPTSNWMTLSTSRPPVCLLRTFLATPLLPLPITPSSSRSSSVRSDPLVLGSPPSLLA